MCNTRVCKLGVLQSWMNASMGLLTAFVLTLAATPAHAAPVSGKISLIVSIEVPGFAPVTVTSAGTVDVSGTTITIAAGALSQGGPVTIPVTGTTSIASIQAVGIANQAATFSLGGITNQLPGEVCAAAAPGEACNSGGGIGGAMGILGTINIIILPGILTLPFGLDRVGEGGAPPTIPSWNFAGFSTGAAFVGTFGTSTAAPGQLTVVGGRVLTADGGPGLALVTPTFIVPGANMLPVFTTLIVPIPEPTTLLLVGAAVTGLAFARRRR